MSASRRLGAVVSLLLLAACAGGPGEPSRAPAWPRHDARVVDLAAEIGALGDSISADEAQRAALSLVSTSQQLRARYRVVGSPRFHNLLVNAGLRDRGLCCHYAEDLIAGLLELGLRTLDVHWVVARQGSRLREHSSVLLVAAGGALADGLVVDGWRHGGELFWSRVSDDRYPWQLHPMSGDWQRLHCR